MDGNSGLVEIFFDLTYYGLLILFLCRLFISNFHFRVDILENVNFPSLHSQRLKRCDGQMQVVSKNSQ